MSPLQRAWTTLWSGLVLAGWDSLVVAWFLHQWTCKVVPTRGSRYFALQMKAICHNVRRAALHSSRPDRVDCDLPRKVQEALEELAWRSPDDGFAFSRLARSLPPPPGWMAEEALDRAAEMASTAFPTSDAAVRSLASYVACAAVPQRTIRRPRRLPQSSSSCLEWPATRGGIDGYLEHLGHQLEAEGASQARFFKFAGDSLGAFCLATARVVLRPCQGVAADLREAYRCAGLLALREMGKPFSMKAEALRTSGYKVRVVGVPDCLTYIEGSWIRESMHRGGLPADHWRTETQIHGPPRGMRHDDSRNSYYSLDLSRATDGLSHDAIRVIVDSLSSRGYIRPADVPMARRSLGLERNGTWRFPKREVPFLRGSPMGTPLSFVILSWTSSWSTAAFRRRLTHGDDAVGSERRTTWGGNPSRCLSVYADRTASVGTSLNRQKTFRANQSWTACEVFCRPEDLTDRMVVVIPPSVPPATLRAPLAADPTLTGSFLRRAERVMTTRFPWLTRDARVHLPVSIGGLGYMGRGLAVGRALRVKLGSLVSREPKPEDALAILSKKPFREVGLYPRPLTCVFKPADHWKAVKAVSSYGIRKPPVGEGMQVTAEQLSSFESVLVEDELRIQAGDTFRRKRASDRPTRTKRSKVFKPLRVKRLAKPLSREFGGQSLDAWALRCRALPITLDPDIASEIRERFPDHTSP